MGTASAYDHANDRLGVGATAPGAKIEIVQAAAADIEIVKDNTTVVRQTYDGGIIDFPKQSGCSIYLNGSQSVATGSAVKINLNAEMYDIQGEYDAATNYKFTATKAGLYLITWTARLLSGADGTYLAALIYVNNAEFAMSKSSVPATDNLGCTITRIAQLAATDYVEFYVIHNYGSNRDIDGTVSTRTFACIHKLA